MGFAFEGFSVARAVADVSTIRCLASLLDHDAVRRSADTRAGRLRTITAIPMASPPPIKIGRAYRMAPPPRLGRDLPYETILYVRDQDIDSLGIALQAVEDRAAPEPLVPRLARLADDDHLDGIFAGEGEDRAGHVGAPERHRHPAELLGQLEVVTDQSLRGRIDPRDVLGRDLDIDGVPGRIEAVGEPGRLA